MGLIDFVFFSLSFLKSFHLILFATGGKDPYFIYVFVDIPKKTKQNLKNQKAKICIQQHNNDNNNHVVKTLRKQYIFHFDIT